MKLLPKALLTTLFSLAAAGCGDATSEDPTDVLLPGDTGGAQQALSDFEDDGKDTFKNETFGGNGRTCNTCHTGNTGTLTPAQAQAAWNTNPSGPLFRAIDSDDGSGASYLRLRTNATVNVEVDLPSNIRLAGSTARKVTLRRAIPSTIDSPALDTMRMFDGRVNTLQAQAAGAIAGHAQAARAPTQYELDSIAAFERTLFSSDAMRKFAKGEGPAPGLPVAVTDSEKRGAAFFAPNALCGSCHNGALLNTNTAFNPLGVPAGTQFGTSLIAERNVLGRPVNEYIVTKSDGSEEHVFSSDPGMMLVTGDAGHKNLFKMMSLRNLKNTPPFFSDGSAKNMAGIMNQYDFVLTAFGVPHTQQDLDDMAAFMNLL